MEDKVYTVGYWRHDGNGNTIVSIHKTEDGACLHKQELDIEQKDRMYKESYFIGEWPLND